jgi:hypothetical protein
MLAVAALAPAPGASMSITRIPLNGRIATSVPRTMFRVTAGTM